MEIGMPGLRGDLALWPAGEEDRCALEAVPIPPLSTVDWIVQGQRHPVRTVTHRTVQVRYYQLWTKYTKVWFILLLYTKTKERMKKNPTITYPKQTLSPPPQEENVIILNSILNVFLLMVVFRLGDPGERVQYRVVEGRKCARAVVPIQLHNMAAPLVSEINLKTRTATHKSASVRFFRLYDCSDVNCGFG